MKFYKTGFLKITLLLLPFLLIASTPKGTGKTISSSKQIIDNMFSAIGQLQTVQYKMKVWERREGRVRAGEQHIKINISPFWLYAYIQKPSKGVEVLWRQGENNNKLLVHPNSFPYVNLNLDPNGSLVRNDSHHNLFAANFNYIASVIRDTYQKSGTDFSDYFKYEGDVLFKGIACYKITVDYTPYKIYNYTVKPGEDVFSIAREKYLNEFKIKELNKLKDYTSLKPGQKISLPNAYAKKTILYIDKNTSLPLVQIMHDELGFYERYECHDLQINPTFKKEEFSHKFPAYNF
jgi:outer membrane lipoprotein-sorting protein